MLAQWGPSSDRLGGPVVFPPQTHRHLGGFLQGPCGPSFLPTAASVQAVEAARVAPRPGSLAHLTAAHCALHPPPGRLRWQHRVRERGEETPQESLQRQLPLLPGQGQG